MFNDEIIKGLKLWKLFCLHTWCLQNENIPLADMPYPEVSTHTPPAGGVLIYPPGHVSELNLIC